MQEDTDVLESPFSAGTTIKELLGWWKFHADTVVWLCDRDVERYCELANKKIEGLRIGDSWGIVKKLTHRLEMIMLSTHRQAYTLYGLRLTWQERSPNGMKTVTNAWPD